MRLYEINTRLHCKHIDEIGDEELRRLGLLGFDAVWLMGVWRISEGARSISKVISPDFEGSPYAVPLYEINPELGGLAAFRRLVERAHKAGLAVIVDFVSNHLALDSPWIAEDPALFIGSDSAVRPQVVSDYFLHSSGKVIAFGKDPYFAPWCDTAQLDYSNPDLRARMSEVLKWIGSIADGVRCDMAMLVLRAQIRRQWYPLASDEWFSQRMPGEFWDEAISDVKRSNPNFITIAEAYWDTEQLLVDLGFDLCYEKKLYDGLAWRNPALIRERMTRPDQNLRRSLAFVENHDEPTAASVFSRQENLAAAALILSLPGSVLIHEGQMEGYRERVPVQLPRRVASEEPDHALRRSYEKIIKATSVNPFRNGAYDVIDTGVESVVGFIRRDSTRLVAYCGQVSGLSQRFGETTLDLSAIFRAAGSAGSLLLTNVLNPELSATLTSGHFIPAPLLSDCDDRFVLVEARSA